MTSRWPYLKNPAFETRYILAGWYLSDCATVVEIGAEELTIDDYVVDRHPGPTRVVVTGPNIKDYDRGAWAYHRSWKFEEIWWCWHSLSRPAPTRPVLAIGPSRTISLNYNTAGIAILGLELMMPHEMWQTLYGVLDKAKKVVIEYPEEHVHSVKQTAMIQRNILNLEETVTFTLELPGSKHGRRRMIVYERKDR